MGMSESQRASRGGLPPALAAAIQNALGGGERATPDNIVRAIHVQIDVADPTGGNDTMELEFTLCPVRSMLQQRPFTGMAAILIQAREHVNLWFDEGIAMCSEIGIGRGEPSEIEVDVMIKTPTQLGLDMRNLPNPGRCNPPPTMN